MNVPFKEGIIAVTEKITQAEAEAAFRRLVEYQERQFQRARWGHTNRKIAAEKVDGFMEYLRARDFDREYLEILKEQYSQWRPPKPRG